MLIFNFYKVTFRLGWILYLYIIIADFVNWNYYARIKLWFVLKTKQQPRKRWFRQTRNFRIFFPFLFSLRSSLQPCSGVMAQRYPIPGPKNKLSKIFHNGWCNQAATQKCCSSHNNLQWITNNMCSTCLVNFPKSKLNHF